MRLRVRAEECGKANVEKLVSMRVPEKGAGGHVFGNPAASRRARLRVQARRGAHPADFARAHRAQAPRRAQARLRARSLRRLYNDDVGDAQKRKKPLSRGVLLKKTGAAADVFAGARFRAVFPREDRRARASSGSSRVRRPRVFGREGKNNKDAHCSERIPERSSAFGLSAARSSRRAPYGADPMAFADGRFDFSPSRRAFSGAAQPDRFPMTAPTAKDLRRLTKKPVLKPKPVVGEYCFGSRIRFDPSMLPPARRFAVAGERAAEAKKKMKNKTAGKKKAAPAREKKKRVVRRAPLAPRNLFAKPRNTRKRNARRTRRASRRSARWRAAIASAPARAGYLRRRRFGISRRMKYTFCKKFAASV